jgi:hypothetical protein
MRTRELHRGIAAIVAACVVTLTFGSSPVSAQERPGGSRRQPERPETPPLELPRAPMAQVLAIGAVRAEIGREDEAGPYMFGSIGGMAMGGDGTLYVSDNATNEIRIFDQGGRHLGTFGRRGRGPGEFVNPIGLVHDGDSTLFALQSFQGITELSARGATVRYRRTFGTGERYSSLCTMNGRLFVSIGGDSAVIRELDTARREIRAFGTAFSAFIYGNPNDAAIKLSRQSGPTLLCDGPRATLYAIRGDQGLLRAYDLDGRQRWETTLPSFKVGIFGAQPGGGAYVAWAIDYIATVMPLGSTRVLVQVARQDLESTRGRSRAPGALITPDVVETRAYLLDAATGRILSQAPGAGLLTPLADTLLAERVTDPWPMLRLRPARVRVP